MAYASHVLSRSETTTLSRARSAQRPGFLARFFRALHESRMRQAEREIALYLERTGGKLTDSTEREIERRFLTPNFN